MERLDASEIDTKQFEHFEGWHRDRQAEHNIPGRHGRNASTGLKYLWIDSLCNVQDEPEFTDWKVEAPKIGDIYQNAELNVANARCGSPTEGLFATRTVTGDETMPSGRCLGKF
jgi:hypothetical protein